MIKGYWDYGFGLLVLGLGLGLRVVIGPIKANQAEKNMNMETEQATGMLKGIRVLGARQACYETPVLSITVITGDYRILADHNAGCDCGMKV